jgi:hypothetical protein
MKNPNSNRSAVTALVTCSWLGACIAACSSDATRVDGARPGAGPGELPGDAQSADPDEPATSAGASPFKSLAAAANAPDIFAAPRAGVPLANDALAFIATAIDATGLVANEADGSADLAGPRAAIFLKPAGAAAPRLLYAGEQLVSPLDIEASADGSTLYVADYAGGSDGSGAILSLPAQGGAVALLAQGYSPRSVTLGPEDELYFSGVDPVSGEPGVFALHGDAVTTVFSGAPLVDPSGIAVFADGRVLVADTRLFDGSVDAQALDGEAGVVLLERGAARVFATGFATGFPAGIALTLDESTLIISGQGPDRSDTVYLVNVAHPEQAPTPVTAAFSAYQDSSAGLKRAHGENTFIWASLSADGGTVFKITN